jgi:hypothetical protein
MKLQLRTVKNRRGFYAVEAPGFAVHRETLNFGMRRTSRGYMADEGNVLDSKVVYQK